MVQVLTEAGMIDAASPAPGHLAALLTPPRDGEAVTRLRLTPPLAVMPGTLELEMTGPSARLRAVVPVRAGQEKAQKGGH
jgi:hypothetical protein